MATTVGFLGIGKMGRPMAGHLAAAGYDVLIYDRRREAAEQLAGTAGIRIAQAAQVVAQSCDVAVLMLPDSAIVNALLWNDGFATSLGPGTLLLDMGSSDPNCTRDNQRRLAALGIAMVDAPVSGGVKRANDASLAIMAGGEAADFERARPLLETLGRTVVHVGPPGAGHALKALNNYVSASGMLAVCEALVAAQRFGIEPATANALFNASTGRNNTTEVKVEQFMLSGKFDSGFAIALMRKDIDTARALMRSLGSAHGFVDACSAAWHQAESGLAPDSDHTAIYAFIQGM
jgi:3-hydroxyisobutyrate dehydrogenase